MQSLRSLSTNDQIAEKSNRILYAIDNQDLVLFYFQAEFLYWKDFHIKMQEIV